MEAGQYGYGKNPQEVICGQSLSSREFVVLDKTGKVLQKYPFNQDVHSTLVHPKNMHQVLGISTGEALLFVDLHQQKAVEFKATQGHFFSGHGVFVAERFISCEYPQDGLSAHLVVRSFPSWKTLSRVELTQFNPNPHELQVADPNTILIAATGSENKLPGVLVVDLRTKKIRHQLADAKYSTVHLRFHKKSSSSVLLANSVRKKEVSPHANILVGTLNNKGFEEVQIGSLSQGAFLKSVALHPDKSIAYVADAAQQKILVCDISAKKLIKAIDCPHLTGVSLGANAEQIFISGIHGQLYWINTETLTYEYKKLATEYGGQHLDLGALLG